MTPTPRLDTKTLEFLRDTSNLGKHDIVMQVIDRFEQNSASLLAQINICIAQADFDTIKRLSHSLKGSAAMIGGRLIAELAQQMESGAAEKDLTTCCRVYEDLSYESDKLLQVLKSDWYQ